MVRQSPWWRTRHLFPRTTAFWIQARRAPHHARMSVRSFFASPSLWTTSVMAGGLAIVLTLLLFVVGPPPEVALEPAGVPKSPLQETVPAPQIALSLHQGVFPIWWDESERLAVQSQPTPGPTPIQFALANSGWTRTSFAVTAAVPDSPGHVAGQLALPTTDAPPLISSSDRPPTSPQITPAAQLGVAVEKVWSSEGVPHELQEYVLIVRNGSSAAVERVVVREAVPDINQLVAVEPPPSVTREGELMWQLDRMDPGAELEINVSYLPAAAGALETRSVADLQSRIGVVTLVSEPLTPDPAVAAPEPAVTEPEMESPDPVFPAGLAGDPAPVLPAEAVLPADDESPPQPLDEPLRDVFPFPENDPEPVLPTTGAPPAVVLPAAPDTTTEEPPAGWPAPDRIEPLEPRPRPLAEPVPLQPLLRVIGTSPEVVARGDVVTTVYEIRNDGTAAAENVTLTVHLTDELLHRHGADVKHAIDRLDAGETRRARLLTRARETGTAMLDATLTHDGGNADSELSYIRVTATGTVPADGDWSASEAAAEDPPAAPDEVLR